MMSPPSPESHGFSMAVPGLSYPRLVEQINDVKEEDKDDDDDKDKEEGKTQGTIGLLDSG